MSVTAGVTGRAVEDSDTGSDTDSKEQWHVQWKSVKQAVKFIQNDSNRKWNVEKLICLCNINRDSKKTKTRATFIQLYKLDHI